MNGYVHNAATILYTVRDFNAHFTQSIRVQSITSNILFQTICTLLLQTLLN